MLREGRRLEPSKKVTDTFALYPTRSARDAQHGLSPVALSAGSEIRLLGRQPGTDHIGSLQLLPADARSQQGTFSPANIISQGCAQFRPYQAKVIGHANVFIERPLQLFEALIRDIREQ
jgi:hypothetical protein